MTISLKGAEHRIETLTKSVCEYFGLCDCASQCTVIDRDFILFLLKEIEILDRSLGIIKVYESPTSEQMAIGLHCLVNQESPSMIYKLMMKAGAAAVFHDHLEIID